MVPLYVAIQGRKWVPLDSGPEQPPALSPNLVLPRRFGLAGWEREKAVHYYRECVRHYSINLNLHYIKDML